MVRCRHLERQIGGLGLAFELGSDQEIQAVWLYYGDGRTQAETAETLGVSRTTAANLLASARRRGLVKIELEPDLLGGVDAARAIRKKFTLKGVHVVPVPEGTATPEIRERLARAAAHLLDKRIANETVLGVASGRTMAALGEEMPRRHRPDLHVVQISGSSIGDEATSPEACTLRIASRLGAHGFNFLAPAVVTNVALRDAMLKEPTLIRHFERIRNCGFVIFSVGELNTETTLAESDELTQAVLPEYIDGQALGVLIGRFIDCNGNEIDGPLRGRQLGPTLDDLLAIPERVCVAGGQEKIAAIRATLAGGYVTHLVTDTDTAALLLDWQR